MEEKIEQYCILAKGARGRALVDLIQKATAEPSLFVFGELLDVESVRELAGTEFSSSLELLKLFAYGTWKDYKAGAESLPPLDDRQKLKLKQLTVVSIVERTKCHALLSPPGAQGRKGAEQKGREEATVPYEHLMSELDISNVRELEDLLITECFYSHVLKGKLDQCKRCLHVHEVIGRDVRVEDLDETISGIESWLGACEGVLKELEERAVYVSAKASEAQERRAAIVAQEDAMGAQAEEIADIGLTGSQESLDMDEAIGRNMMEILEDEPASSRPKRRR
uniref:COP9 signalosome complex subunit 7 n=1 Tax=Tetraselmis sp. GSL018 TaxID=582737 RepID=A0A061RVR6_9CHLO